MSKGKFTLPSSVQATTGASFNSAWSDVSTPATFTLDGINVSTAGHVNETIVGKDGDNFTFYMIPQSLSGLKVKVYFDNQPNPCYRSTAHWYLEGWYYKDIRIITVG